MGSLDDGVRAEFIEDQELTVTPDHPRYMLSSA